MSFRQVRPAAASVPALIPFAEHAKHALQRTFAEAQHLSADTIGSEHVLLAVLAVEAGTLRRRLRRPSR